MGGIAKYLDLYKRCPKSQLFNLKTIHDHHKSYLKRLERLPVEKPIIDWDYYKAKVGINRIQIVEEFQQKYESMEIPYPEDKYSEELDQIACDIQTELDCFNEESNKRIEIIQGEAKKVEETLPYYEMTVEEYYILRPENALDSINNPTFWPHTEEEQLSPEQLKQLQQEQMQQTKTGGSPASQPEDIEIPPIEAKTVSKKKNDPPSDDKTSKPKTSKTKTSKTKSSKPKDKDKK